MGFKNLLLENNDGICLLTINRPKVLNALNIETVKELGEAADQIMNDSEIKGVIMTGAGSKSFVAGADISELHDLDNPGAVEYATRGQRILSKFEMMEKPVIAAVNGFALGGGTELAMACNIRIASENAKFGQPEVKLGVIPGYGGTQRLARLVGKGRAMELCLTGAVIDANEAYRIGLVNKVTTQESLLEEAEKMMREIMAQGPVAVSLCLQSINEGMELPLFDGLKVEADMFGKCADSSDWKEGTAAFMDKRKPEFKGK